MKVTAKNRALIIAISMLFILFFKYIPAPAGMSMAAMQVVGIFIGVLIMWMTISIDWPSMLCLAALVLCYMGGDTDNVVGVTNAYIGYATVAFVAYSGNSAAEKWLTRKYGTVHTSDETQNG